MITSRVKSMLIAYEGMQRWTWNVQLPMQGAMQGWIWFNFRIINLLIKFWGTGYAWPGSTVTTVQNKRIERVKFTCTPNGKPEFVPRDQVFPLVVVYCLLLLLKIKFFHASFIHKNCSGQLLSTYFLFWRILNLNLTFAVCRERDS